MDVLTAPSNGREETTRIDVTHVSLDELLSSQPEGALAGAVRRVIDERGTGSDQSACRFGSVI